MLAVKQQETLNRPHEIQSEKLIDMILEKIEQLLEEINNINVTTAEEIEAIRLKYLSKKGEISGLMAEFRNVPAEQKKVVGMKLNELKQTATERINTLKEQLCNEVSHEANLDLTRTPYPIPLGTRHPLTIVTNEIIDIFSRMGFILADGPEVEDDMHVFTKMNFAADHPARDMQDTFFVEHNPNDVTKNIILRSHTSSVQEYMYILLHYMKLSDYRTGEVCTVFSSDPTAGYRYSYSMSDRSEPSGPGNTPIHQKQIRPATG